MAFDQPLLERACYGHISREEAEALLTDQPDGTFLVRKSSLSKLPPDIARTLPPDSEALVLSLVHAHAQDDATSSSALGSASPRPAPRDGEQEVMQHRQVVVLKNENERKYFYVGQPSIVRPSLLALLRLSSIYRMPLQTRVASSSTCSTATSTLTPSENTYTDHPHSSFAKTTPLRHVVKHRTYTHTVVDSPVLVPYYAGHLNLDILSAQGLNVEDSRVSPYVVINVVSSTKPQLPENHGKTAVLSQNAEPAWNESFSFDFGLPSESHHKLRLEVWSWEEYLCMNKFLGQVELSLVPGERLQEDVRAELELPLVPRPGNEDWDEVSGTIKFKVRLTADYHRERDERREERVKIKERAKLSPKTAGALIQALKRQTSASRTIGPAELQASLGYLDPIARKELEAQEVSAESLFDCVDISHNGSLDLEESLIGLCTLATGTIDDKVYLIFSALDLENNGCLYEDNFVEQCRKLFKVYCAHLKKMLKESVMRRFHQPVTDEELEPFMEAITEPLRPALIRDNIDYLFCSGGKIMPDDWQVVMKKEELCVQTYLARVEEPFLTQYQRSWFITPMNAAFLRESKGKGLAE